MNTLSVCHLKTVLCIIHFVVNELVLDSENTYVTADYLIQSSEMQL